MFFKNKVFPYVHFFSFCLLNTKLADILKYTSIDTNYSFLVHKSTVFCGISSLASSNNMSL